MANRLVQGDLGAPFDREGAVLALDRTGPSAIRAGVEVPQSSGLLVEQNAEGALGQAGGSGGGDLLHGGEVEGARLRTKASSDDFAPLDSERADLGQLLLGRFAFGHGQPLPRLALILVVAFLVSLYRHVLAPAKRVLASPAHLA
jgi:hypothetical protein